MNRGVGTPTCTVVPDTGTHALRGLAGTIAIDILDKQHKYTFDYTIDPRDQSV